MLGLVAANSPQPATNRKLPASQWMLVGGVWSEMCCHWSEATQQLFLIARPECRLSRDRPGLRISGLMLLIMAYLFLLMSERILSSSLSFYIFSEGHKSGNKSNYKSRFVGCQSNIKWAPMRPSAFSEKGDQDQTLSMFVVGLLPPHQNYDSLKSQNSCLQASNGKDFVWIASQ